MGTIYSWPSHPSDLPLLIPWAPRFSLTYGLEKRNDRISSIEHSLSYLFSCSREIRSVQIFYCFSFVCLLLEIFVQKNLSLSPRDLPFYRSFCLVVNHLPDPSRGAFAQLTNRSTIAYNGRESHHPQQQQQQQYDKQ